MFLAEEFWHFQFEGKKYNRCGGDGICTVYSIDVIIA